MQAAHGLIMEGGGGFGGGSEDEKGVERTEQRWRRRPYQEGGRGKVTAPTAIVQAVQKHAPFKNSRNCETLNCRTAQRSLFSTKDVRALLWPRSSAGIYPLHLELTKR